MSERRTNTRNQNISKNIGTMPNIREKLASGKKKLSTKLATGKEKMRAGGEKLKLKVLFLLLREFVQLCVTNHCDARFTRHLSSVSERVNPQ